jgi:hypothetical protein
MEERIAKTDWVRGLKAFTERNAGRRTSLEEDAVERGAQLAEHDYPLRGVTYDPKDDRVEIMLGDQGSVDRHLTHVVVAPESVDLTRTTDGRDSALRIRHDGGAQTVLRLFYEV